MDITYVKGDIIRAPDKKSNFKKGSVELLVLHLLSIQDCYGYQLTQLIEELSNGKILVQEGSLYPVLYKLSEAEHTTQIGRASCRERV